MNTVSKKAPVDNVAEAEKMLVAAILTHLGHLLIAKSPIKSKAQQEAEQYRGQLLSKMSSEERVPFLKTREIIVELATLLAKNQTREMMGKVMTYLSQLNKGEIYLVDEPNEDGIKRKLGEFFDRHSIEFNDAALSTIIGIVVNVIPQAEYETETTEPVASMTAREIIERLKAEGIPNDQLLDEKNWPEWVGPVLCVDRVHNRQTDEDLENAHRVYKLQEHNIYLMLCGVVREQDDDDDDRLVYENDDDNEKDWDWHMLRETKPERIRVFY